MLGAQKEHMNALKILACLAALLQLSGLLIFLIAVRKAPVAEETREGFKISKTS